MKLGLFIAMLSIAAATPGVTKGSHLRGYAKRQETPREKLPGDTPSGVVCQGPGGRVADVPGHRPLKQVLQSNTPGTKRVMMR